MNHPFGVARAVALGWTLAWALAGCNPASAPQAAWPDGTLVIGRNAALAQILGQLQLLPESKLGRRAAELAHQLPDCDWIEATRAVGASHVRTEIACHPHDARLASLAAMRGEADAVFALPKRDGERVTGTLHLGNDGDLEARFRIPRSSFADARGLLQPGSVDPGPNLLDHTDELVHARLRPENGLDIASLIPAQGAANQMFRLKSEIFAGAVLDGTWEIAIYLPEPGHPMPRAALAVGFELRAPAVAAIEQFITDLQESWPVRRTPYSLGAASGACLPELNLIPDLAPCYVASDSALVVGWNAASLERALGSQDAAADSPHSAGGIHVDLARFPEADARFARTADPDRSGAPGRSLPWQRMTAVGRPDSDGVHVRVRLEKGDGA